MLFTIWQANFIIPAMKLLIQNHKFFLFLIFICVPIFSYSQPLIRKNFGAYIGNSSISDFDNDGDMDIAAFTRVGFQNRFIIYKNINGVYTADYQFSDLITTSLFFDYNNDNTYELMGSLANSNSSKIYALNNNIWQPVFTIPYKADVFCVTDCNSDNKTDVFFYSTNSYILDGKTSQITQHTNFDNLLISYCHSTDFNGDGKLDLLMIARPKLCGATACPPDSNQIFIAYNIDTNYQITKINNTIGVNSIFVRDYDKDGDYDILFCDNFGITILENHHELFLPVYSYPIENVEYVSWINATSNNVYDIFFTLADNNSYLLTNNYLTSLGFGTKNYILADFDNDGDIDLLTTNNILGGNRLYGFFLNNLTSSSFVQNQPPDAPQNLSVTQVADTTYFHWNASTDDTTPQNALTYNLYIGSTPGTTDIMSPLSDLATGYRKIVSIGNVDANLGWKIVGLPCGTYYWSVQAVDNAYAGGEFAVEQSFTISCGIEANNFCLGEFTTFSASFTNIQSVLWHFGDSQTSTELNPTHTYASAGTYTVTLEVTFADNSTQTVTKDIEIFDKPLKPIIEHK